MASPDEDRPGAEQRQQEDVPPGGQGPRRRPHQQRHDPVNMGGVQVDSEEAQSIGQQVTISYAASGLTEDPAATLAAAHRRNLLMGGQA